MNAVEVYNIKKKFRVYYDKGQSFKERILFRNRNHYEERWVLKGLSFSVKKGEAIGLIGENGSGKSTTLKLLTRIIHPDEGSIKITGRVSSLIELGAGFHPDMSGRENIYTNAAIFGLTRKEIEERLEDIISFSELGQFIDNPVRTYSSGMYMRLAFAVAINVDADVLLIDEILSVGDASFQAKCFNKLREIKASGTTIVIVSHSLGQIEQICDKSIWIADGVIEMKGTPREVHPAYLEYMGNKQQIEDMKNANQENDEPQQEISIDKSKNAGELNEQVKKEQKNRWGNGDAKIQSVELVGDDGNPKRNFKTGEKLVITIKYNTYKELINPTVGIGIFRNDGLQCYGTNTFIDHIQNIKLHEKGIIKCVIEANSLLEGEYSLDVAIHTEDGFAYDYYRNALTFKMHSDIADVGIMRLMHQWKFEAGEIK